MIDLSHWLWPTLFFLLAATWLWTFLRQRQSTSEGRGPGSELTYSPAEAEDALKAAYALHEAGRALDGEELARSMSLPGTLARELSRALVACGWAEEDNHGKIHLTEVGEARARELIRVHRLWERYLVDREKMPLHLVHAEADRREHETTPEELERLDAQLGHPAWDPHGHAIPAPGFRLPSPPGRPLLDKGTPGSRLRIVSMDDEPAPLLANAAARHVFVVPAPALPVPLGELPIGSRTRVVEVKGSGKHQRRMLDMGLVPGSEVVVIREAPLHDPVEYRVKGTAVSMRRVDANTILVEEMTHG